LEVIEATMAALRVWIGAVGSHERLSGNTACDLWRALLAIEASMADGEAPCTRLSGRAGAKTPAFWAGRALLRMAASSLRPPVAADAGAPTAQDLAVTGWLAMDELEELWSSLTGVVRSAQ
jgi:hypothetical protein